MRVVARSRLGLPMVRLGDAAAAPAQDHTDLQVQVRPSTALAGVGLWVMAGVLTHLAVRVIDRWFFDEK